jgi:heme/copper-type cytochrome/quinol oxidase subunit 4
MFRKDVEMKKKIVTGLIVVVVIVGLIWTAQVLVSNFDILQFMKSLHGG